jgi:threonyl-tRNA synthetase
MSDENPGRDPDDFSRLYRIRHSTAHILATAIQQMYPDARFAIGPPIEDGFYYDFELPETISTDDFDEIEGRMTSIVHKDFEFEQEVWDKEEAIEYFQERNEPYKLELIEDIDDDVVSIYKDGPFTDLCAGPHVESTSECANFKLLKVAGAYWRGDEDNTMLQRIYGTAFETEEQLDDYMFRMEEAKRRDHRKLGNELDLYYFDDRSPGSVFWMPRGWTAYREMKNYFREIEEEQDYVEINNPMLYDRELFEQSGHWDHYQDNLFTMEEHDRTWCLKPMNCPDTMTFFAKKKRSYRELPLRVAEFGTLHRNEIPGALSGATRVRQMMQDDAHIFLQKDQIEGEIELLLEMVDRTYSMLDMRYDIELSTRPDDSMGSDELWEEAESALKSALEENDKPYDIHEGDGAFYGPKIDFQVRDSLGRSWQCATIQLDFQLPQRFDLTYTAEDNSEKTPIVIHRAVAGSLERFFAITVEHLAGAFPTWLAPEQVRILTITDDVHDYAYDVAELLEQEDIRVEVDIRSEKIGYKIREAEEMKIPYMFVIGGDEADDGTVAVRTYKDGRQGNMEPEEVRDEIVDRIENRTLDVEVERSGLRDVAEAHDEGDSEMEERGY